MKSYLLVFFFFLFLLTIRAQNNSHPFSNSWAITGQGGATIAMTDFPESKVDYFGQGSLEYYLPTSSANVFGFRVFAGTGFLAGEGLNITDPLYADINEFYSKIVYGGVGLVYSLSLGDVVQPYISANAAYLIFDPFKSDDSKMPRNAAGEYTTDDIDYMGEFGIRFLVSESVSLNLSYAFNYVINDNLDDIWGNEDDMFHSISGGISYYIMPNEDSDSDGIKDSRDLCENTPLGVAVDEFGCPLDSDADKIPDYLDMCADTPLNVPVDEEGCPKDSDMDGIADFIDDCPDTPQNVLVDEKGCEKILLTAAEEKEQPDSMDQIETPSLTLSGAANFELGNAQLLPNPKSGLKKMVEYMKENPSTRWVLEGHTDNVGKKEVNKKLSEERAQSVLNFFVSHGIDAERFEVIGAGAANPAADNAVEFGRAVNRRVVIEEERSYLAKMKAMETVKSIDYDYSSEYNIEGLIFTDNEYYCIQVSSWKDRDKANEEVAKLRSNGHSAFFILTQVGENKENWFRVRVGFFDNLQGARDYINRIR